MAVRANERTSGTIGRSSVGSNETRTIASIHRSIHTSTLNCTFPYVFTIHHYPAVRLSKPCSINSLRRAGKKSVVYCWLVLHHEARINTSEDNILQAREPSRFEKPKDSPPFVMMFCIGRFILTFLILCLNFTAQMYSIIARMRL